MLYFAWRNREGICICSFALFTSCLVLLLTLGINVLLFILGLERLWTAGRIILDSLVILVASICTLLESMASICTL